MTENLQDLLKPLNPKMTETEEQPTTEMGNVNDDSVLNEQEQTTLTENDELNAAELKLNNVWYHLRSKPTNNDIKYENENGNTETPMTTHNEIIGWILYDAANSPYQQVGIALGIL